MMELSKEQEFMQIIVQKAWEDASFKKELIANPLFAIEKLTGKTIQLQEGKTLVVRDQTDNSTVFVNIPAQQETDNVELNEEQLEDVAGGIIGPDGCFPNPIKIPTFPSFEII